jgi:hypothetical protein
MRGTVEKGVKKSSAEDDSALKDDSKFKTRGFPGMAISIAMVMLGDGVKLSLVEIQRDLAANWSNLPPATDLEKKDLTLSFSLGDSQVILGLMPAPIPWNELEGPCVTSWLWPEAAEKVRAHKKHLIVTVLSEESPLDRARVLTQVVAAIVGTCPAVGVYWGDATLVIPSPVFREFAINVLPEGPPIHIWVDLRAGRNESGRTSGFTTGLKALGLMEFETSTAGESPGDLRERFVALASYLLENGPVIRDGDTVGEEANERIRVVYAPSAFGNPERVMRLDYGR